MVTTGDFTGNGVLDLAVGLQSPNSVAIELNQGTAVRPARDGRPRSAEQRLSWLT